MVFTKIGDVGRRDGDVIGGPKLSTAREGRQDRVNKVKFIPRSKEGTRPNHQCIGMRVQARFSRPELCFGHRH